MTHKNIVGTFLLATAQEITAGAQWYNLASEVALRIAQDTTVSYHRAAGVIAALSPNNKWERNCADAEAVCKAYAAGGLEAAAAVKVCTYGKMLAKALLVLEVTDEADIPAILNGQKIRAFYLSIIGNSHEVVVDGHAYSIWIGQRLTMKQVPNIGKKLYASICADYVEATRIINGMGNSFTPAQVQAITWVAHKRIHGV
jgi:hypothetical protein